MNRLFINLYIVIVCGLLAINYVSEQLWTLYVTDSDNVINTQPFIELLPRVISTSKSDINLVSDALNVPVNIMPISDVAWLAEQHSQLLSGQAIIQFNELDIPIFYVKAADTELMYQIGPFVNYQQPAKNIYIKWSLLALSYLLLAGVISLWIRPLWRDLNQLNAMADSVAAGEHEVKVNTSSMSPIHHVVMNFYQMSHRVKRLLEDQKHLVNAVSHELRTPLSRVKFALALLPNSAEQINNTASNEAIKDIEQDIKEIETLIDEMLGYARLENINQSMSKTSINLSHLIDEQINKLVFTRSIKISKNIAPSIQYSCNQQLIERAVQNILINVLRYANNQINITLNIRHTVLVLLIEDDGVGIAEEQAYKVFEPFYRLESSSNNKHSTSNAGFGLGLAIVKRICDWHGAICKVERSSLGGCKFILSFPYSK